MMKNLKIKWYLVLVMVLFVFVLYFSLKDNYIDIINTLSDVNIIWLIIGVLFVFISKYVIGLITYYLAKKEKEDISLWQMVKIALIYPFFAGITPSAVGGESFEIFYLKDSGISYGKASNIAIQKFILYQVALVIIDTVVVILNMFTNIIPDTSLVGSSITLNFIVNIAILIFSYLVTYNRKFNHFIVEKGVVFLHKIRIIKDLDKTKKKVDNYLDNFNEGAEEFKKDKKFFTNQVILSIISYIFLMIAAWPIARALGIYEVNVLNLFIIATYAKMMCLLIVTPGNSGAAEYCFIYLFTGLINEDGIMTYMLIWRFVTYYIPLILGGILAMTWGRGKNGEKDSCSKS